MFADVRRIQKSIQVTTAQADEHRARLEQLLVGRRSSPTVMNSATPATRLTTIAAPVPSQIRPKAWRFPVRARYDRMIEMISAASTPSRRPVSRPEVRDPTSNVVLPWGRDEQASLRDGARRGRCYGDPRKIVKWP